MDTRPMAKDSTDPFGAQDLTRLKLPPPHPRPPGETFPPRVTTPLENGALEIGKAMAANGPSESEKLLAGALGGQPECLGKLLQLYRNYLHLLARTQIDLHLQGRADASDLVQETFLDACRDFEQFRGSTEAELLAWLRKILVFNIARLVQQQVLTQKRDARREISLERHLAELDRSSACLERGLVGPQSSPSAQAQRRERAAVLADALARLPRDYQEVIVLRNLEGLPFTEVAQRMNRTSGAVRILWVRALDQLRQILEREDVL